MKLEELRDKFRGEGLKPEKILWVITTNGLDGEMYYISEGADFQGVWSKTIANATKFERARLPGTISSGCAKFAPRTVIKTKKYGDGLAYVVENGNTPDIFAVAFPMKTRDY